jgi:large subunit ribosomal protein L22
VAFGTKTNERPGVRAQVRHARVSAYKAREVLDLIRGEQVGRALEILEFSERDVAQIILKCLESAIANAEFTAAIPPDELEVAACFADEGPTLKRWRPRARGRATRIRKRTCHITIIVGRIDEDRLELMREREATTNRGGRRAADARRQRVLRSRQAKADKRAAESDEHDHDHDHDDEAVTDEAVTDEAVTDEAVTDEAVTDEAETAEDSGAEAENSEDTKTDDTDTEDTATEAKAEDGGGADDADADDHASSDGEDD